MTILWIDFETRSKCDLPSRGVYNYAQDLSTEVLCMSYAFDDDDVRTWLPREPFPQAVRDHNGLVYAHNAAFEDVSVGIFWLSFLPRRDQIEAPTYKVQYGLYRFRDP
jgi:hypothetical protein